MVKTILDFSDKPLSSELLLDCCREKRSFMEKGVEMAFNWREISGLWRQFCPNFESAPTSDSLFLIESAVAADFKLMCIFPQFQAKSNLSNFLLECLHNQLHLQPNISLKSFDQWERKYRIYCVLIGGEKFSSDCCSMRTGPNLSNTTLYRRVIFK